MSVTMDGIYVDGQKAKFRPEDILTGDPTAYTEEIGTAVNAWMEENVTGGEQVTDTTLTLSGVPADAKVTGDEISSLKEDLSSFNVDVIKCESGSFNDSDCTKIVKVSRIRNTYPIPIVRYNSITIPNGYSAWIYRLTADGSYINYADGWKSGEVEISSIATSATKYINIVMRNDSTPNADISDQVETVENGLILDTCYDAQNKRITSELYNEENRTVGVHGIFGYLRADNIWAITSPIESSVSMLIAVKPNVSYLIRSTNTCVGAFLKSIPSEWSHNTAMSNHYATGASRTTFTSGMQAGITPSDAKYLIISEKVNGQNWSPTTLIIDRYDFLKNIINNCNTKLSVKKHNAVAYVSGNAISWKHTTLTNCELTIDDYIVIRDKDHSSTAIEFSADQLLALAEASSAVTVIDGVISGTSFAIYYNFNTSNLAVSAFNIADVFDGDSILLFGHFYTSYTGGALVDSLNGKNYEQLQKVSSGMESLSPIVVPDYLISEVESVVSSIKSACTEKSMVIAFTTDNHYGASNGINWTDTINSIKMINSKYKIDVVIDGGDMINGDEAVATSKARLSEMLSNMNIPNVRSYALVGNHDDNSFTADQEVQIPQDNLYALIGRPTIHDYDSFNGSKTYGYKDFHAFGIRLVTMDARIGDGRIGEDPLNWGYDTDQITWFTNIALDTELQVVVFSHMGLTSEYAGSTQGNFPVNGSTIRSAIETFIANGGTFIGWFHGHNHWDYIGQYSQTNGFKEVSTGCSRVSSGPIPSSWHAPEGAVMPERTAGTITQELYDIIIIKPESKEVQIIRFGAGNDRSFAY